MKIKNITPLVLGTPWRNLTFLKVETDEGLVGYSEGRNVNRTEALLGYLEGIKKRYVVGSDPSWVKSRSWWGVPPLPAWRWGPPPTT